MVRIIFQREESEKDEEEEGSCARKRKEKVKEIERAGEIGKKEKRTNKRRS